ncbi:MAG: alpha/beta hydrolase [Pseudomonadota bacterium]
MRISVNGVRLYFDVEGAQLVPDGASVRERPTLILLHGGPGADHFVYKPDMSPLAEVAQLIYLDQRGNGRSDASSAEHWTLAQWAEDLAAFCDALEIARPVVLGASFGGFVAQAFATMYPDRLSGLILTSSAAKFDFAEMIAAFGEIGGPAARDAAEAYWMAPTSESRRAYHAACLPLYTRTKRPEMFARLIIKDDVALHFNGPRNEQGRMDFRAALARVTCPVLVMAGETDPVTPIAFSQVIVDHLTNATVRFARFADCGHGVLGDQPEAARQEIAEFLSGL